MRKKGKKVSAKSDINITPLIDILLVLLVIFMTITPQAPKALDAAIPQPPPPDYVPPPQQQNELIIVSINKDETLKINQDPVDVAELGNRLKDIFRSRLDKTMFVNGDHELDYEKVVAIIDIAKGSGVDKVGLMTERLMAP